MNATIEHVCAICGRAIKPDHRDPNGGPDHETAVWRDADSWAVCPGSRGETWHRPAESHPGVRCSWLAKCEVS